MNNNAFIEQASNEKNINWQQHILRSTELYKRENDIRSPYERDYTRVLHSLAYRRLKHKTQVFFNIDNDHICTRMEHVQHVESVSCTIAKYLGLNVDLTRAIAMGHDLGHTPFGHEGESVLSKICLSHGLDKFWHEKNSLRIIDSIEVLEDNEGNYQNLNLTYAVRDGIIAHCGEVDENGIIKRSTAVDLKDFLHSGQYQAYTWEGCVVKLADKIAYLGRDIEDAIRVHFIDIKGFKELKEISHRYGETALNTTVIIHNFITSVCENSTPEKGIRLSEDYNSMLNEIKAFNYKAIYNNKRFETYKKYVALVINSIHEVLFSFYAGEDTIKKLSRCTCYPMLSKQFTEYLEQFSELDTKKFSIKRYKNRKIYGRLETEQLYAQAIVDYISGMTDRYAVTVFNELLKY